MDYSLKPLPKRDENSNKGTFGKVLNIAGSFNYPGAAYLSSVSALRTGAGLVALGAEKEVIQSLAAQTPDIVYVLREDVINSLSDYTVVSIGCGLSVNGKTAKFFNSVWARLAKLSLPVVLDASGLTILSGIKNAALPQNLIITPHPGEAARLLGCEVREIVANPDYYVKLLAEKFCCVAVLKGHNTRVCDGKTLYVNFTGNSALAKAGSGDVLCGMITGLLAQGMNAFDAATLAVHIHGLCGELAAEKLGKHSVLASDLLQFLPFAMQEYSKRLGLS